MHVTNTSNKKVIQAIGQKLKVRQQVIATAIVYFRRFYSKNRFCDIDPLLLAPTAVYLASKVEEFGTQQVKNVITKTTEISMFLTLVPSVYFSADMGTVNSYYRIPKSLPLWFSLSKSTHS
eukprot:Colp12_sorted_trinity150504_noHs@7884